MAEQRVRRSRCIVCYWDGGEFVIRNFLRGTEVVASPGVLALLDELAVPKALSQVRARLLPAGATKALDSLLAEHILVREGSAVSRQEDRLEAVWKWGVDAKHFHYATRDVDYTFDQDEVRQALAEKARRDPPPPPFKSYESPPQPLPRYESRGQFWATLRKRRTCRSFSKSPIDLDDLSALLGNTFGMLRYFDGAPLDRRLVKTSPSGGARHPIEAYCFIQRVRGMAAGLYHYDVRTHGMTRLRRRVSESEVVRLFAGQSWVADAAVVVVMTAVLPRSMWKYDHSRAYRVVMLDAGHLGQTFHLAATELGFGVFTSAALKDREVEQLLGIDGIEEVVLYGGAVGCAGAADPAESGESMLPTSPARKPRG